MVSAEAGLSGRYLSRVTGDVVGLVGSHAVSSRDYQGYGIVKLSAAATLNNRYKLTVDIDNLLNYRARLLLLQLSARPRARADRHLGGRHLELASPGKVLIRDESDRCPGNAG